MLQHSTNDFYDLSSNIASNRQTPPSYSPNGPSSMNNNSIIDVGSSGSAATTNSNSDRDAMPSFGFTQEQVACVCEVRHFFKYLINYCVYS